LVAKLNIHKTILFNVNKATSPFFGLLDGFEHFCGRDSSGKKMLVRGDTKAGVGSAIPRKAKINKLG